MGSFNLEAIFSTPPQLMQLDSIIHRASIIGLWDYSRTMKTLVLGRTPRWNPLFDAPKYSKDMTAEQRKAVKAERKRIKARNIKKGGEGGYLKALWKETMMPDGFSLTNEAHYGPVVETGGYRGVGPRTVRQSGRVFSRQAPGGIVKPLLEDKNKLNGIVKAIAAEIEKALSQGNIGT